MPCRDPIRLKGKMDDDQLLRLKKMIRIAIVAAE